MVEAPNDADLLFKALADPSRRMLLDLLHAHDGRTLTELCEHLDMTRQGVTQHLDQLEAANLGRHCAAWPREAALPQSGAAAGDLRALDCQVRKAAPARPSLTQTSLGRKQRWLGRSLSTSPISARRQRSCGQR